MIRGYVPTSNENRTFCKENRIFKVRKWAQGNPVFITRNGFVISEKFGSDKIYFTLLQREGATLCKEVNT